MSAGEHIYHKFEIMKIKLHENRVSSILHDRIRYGENWCIYTANQLSEGGPQEVGVKFNRGQASCIQSVQWNSYTFRHAMPELTSSNITKTNDCYEYFTAGTVFMIKYKEF